MVGGVPLDLDKLKQMKLDVKAKSQDPYRRICWRIKQLLQPQVHRTLTDWECDFVTSIAVKLHQGQTQFSEAQVRNVLRLWTNCCEANLVDVPEGEV